MARGGHGEGGRGYAGVAFTSSCPLTVMAVTEVGASLQPAWLWQRLLKCAAPIRPRTVPYSPMQPRIAPCSPTGSHLHLLRAVELWLPVRDPAHAALPIAKFLTKGPILGLGVPAAVGVVEGNVEEERPRDGEGGDGGGVAKGCPPPPRPSLGSAGVSWSRREDSHLIWASGCGVTLRQGVPSYL